MQSDMAKPLKSGKRSVDLASSPAPVSRIRRDPPPVVKTKPVNLDERERWDVAIGVLAFALSVFVIILALGSYSGWSPRDYTIHIEDS